MKNLTLQNMARSLMMAGFITFSVVGIAIAAGAGDQTGQQGDMSGHGGPVDKKAGSDGGQKSGTAPEPSTYRQSGAAGSGYSGGSPSPSLERNNSSSGEGKKSQGDGTTDNAGKGTGGQDDSFSMSSRKKGAASPVQGAGTASGSSQGSGSSGGSSGSSGQ